MTNVNLRSTLLFKVFCHKWANGVKPGFQRDKLVGNPESKELEIVAFTHDMRTGALLSLVNFHRLERSEEEQKCNRVH